MFKYFFIFVFFLSFTNSHAENKDKIKEKLQNTKNLVFEFEQNINGKIENGNCTIQYPKKIYCKYIKNNKILVSNSKSLVIKTISSYYRYSLKKTPLDLILDISAYQKSSVEFKGAPRTIVEVHYEDYRIWGATAAILYHLATEISKFRN